MVLWRISKSVSVHIIGSLGRYWGFYRVSSLVLVFSIGSPNWKSLFCLHSKPKCVCDNCIFVSALARSLLFPFILHTVQYLSGSATASSQQKHVFHFTFPPLSIVDSQMFIFLLKFLPLGSYRAMSTTVLYSPIPLDDLFRYNFGRLDGMVICWIPV